MEIQSTQVCISLKSLFSRHKGIGVQFTDEPTGNLDSRSTEIVMDVFSMIHSKMHKTVIMVTHDISVAEYSERTLYIEDGKITEDR